MKTHLQLYPRGRAFCSPFLCFLLAGTHWDPVTLYQEGAAAASLAVGDMSFPLVSWATFSNGCLENQPLLLQGEEGPNLAKTDSQYPPFAAGSWRMAPKMAHLFLSLGEPQDSHLILPQPQLSPLQVGESPLLIGRSGQAAIFTSPHNAMVP